MTGARAIPVPASAATTVANVSFAFGCGGSSSTSSTSTKKSFVDEHLVTGLAVSQTLDRNLQLRGEAELLLLLYHLRFKTEGLSLLAQKLTV